MVFTALGEVSRRPVPGVSVDVRMDVHRGHDTDKLCGVMSPSVGTEFALVDELIERGREMPSCRAARLW